MWLAAGQCRYIAGRVVGWGGGGVGGWGVGVGLNTGLRQSD